MLTTFRRNKLRKLIEAGRVETIETYSFDDMHGESRGHKVMPVAMHPGDWKDCKTGTCYMREHDFTSKSGSCYVRNPADGIVTLIVHGNSNYSFRIIEARHPVIRHPTIRPGDAASIMREETGLSYEECLVMTNTD